MSYGLGAAFGMGVGLGVGYGTISEYARLGILLAKWNLLPEKLKKDALAQTLQSILSAEKDPNTGLSTKGMVDVLYDFIDKTLWISVLTDESIATQMFVQMIQQSVAYAIQYSHAGAIGTVCNVYSGSSSITAWQSEVIGENLRNVDDKFLAFLSASTGTNLSTLMFQLMRGGNRLLDHYVARLIRDVEGLVDEWNDLALDYYRRWHTLARQRFINAVTMKEDVVQRAYQLVEQAGRDHLSRIVELLDTLEGAKHWWDAGLISDDELKMIANRIDLERYASEQDYDSFKNAVLGKIDEALSEWDAKIEQALNDLTDMEKSYNNLIKSILTPIFEDVMAVVEELISRIETAVEDVRRYRCVPPVGEPQSGEVTPPAPPPGYVAGVLEEGGG